MKSFYFLCFICITILAGCNGPATEKQMIPVDSMRLIIWDMMKADEWFARTIIKDSNAIKTREDIKMYEQVFKVYGISKDRFYKSYRYYESNPVVYKTMIDSLDALAGRERIKRLSNNKP